MGLKNQNFVVDLFSYEIFLQKCKEQRQVLMEWN